MKALSLWQPWASAMARGVKTIETRSWFTSYRGDLVICSALKKPGRELWAEMGGMAYEDALALPYGCALCVVRLEDVLRTADLIGAVSEVEQEFGDFTPGRYAWLTRDLRRLKRPVPIRGRQGLWKPEGAALDAIKAML